MDVEKIASAIKDAISELTDRPPRLAYSLDEAAVALGVTRRTIEGMIDTGQVKAKLIGRHLRISVDQLRKVLQ